MPAPMKPTPVKSGLSAIKIFLIVMLLLFLLMLGGLIAYEYSAQTSIVVSNR